MSSNLPPGVTDAMIEEFFGPEWSEAFERESLSDAEIQLLGDAICEDEALYDLVTRIGEWFVKTDNESRKGDDQMYWDMHIAPQLDEAGIDSKRVRQIMDGLWGWLLIAST